MENWTDVLQKFEQFFQNMKLHVEESEEINGEKKFQFITPKSSFPKELLINILTFARFLLQISNNNGIFETKKTFPLVEVSTSPFADLDSSFLCNFKILCSYLNSTLLLFLTSRPMI